MSDAKSWRNKYQELHRAIGYADLALRQQHRAAGATDGLVSPLAELVKNMDAPEDVRTHTYHVLRGVID